MASGNPGQGNKSAMDEQSQEGTQCSKLLKRDNDYISGLLAKTEGSMPAGERRQKARGCVTHPRLGMFAENSTQECNHDNFPYHLH